MVATGVIAGEQLVWGLGFWGNRTSEGVCLYSDTPLGPYNCARPRPARPAPVVEFMRSPGSDSSRRLTPCWVCSSSCEVGTTRTPGRPRTGTRYGWSRCPATAASAPPGGSGGSTRRAQVRAALEGLADRRVGGCSELDRCAAGRRGWIDAMVWIELGGGPLPNVSDHVEQAKPVGRKPAHREVPTQPNAPSLR